MRRVLLLALMLLLTGALLSACMRPRGRGGGGGGGSGDNSESDDDDFSDGYDGDEDGLSDDYEEEIGTDPEDDDTDGDGWSDGEEVEGNADPLDSSDHPYTGGWPRSPLPDWLDGAATGTSVGSIAADFSLMDQYGEQVSLWSFVGNVILVESIAEW